MKKLNYTKLIPIMAFMAISTFVLNYKAGVIIKHVKIYKLQTDTLDLGEFEYPTGSGTLYDVHGTSSPNVVTGVYFYWTGLPVSSFSGRGWNNNGNTNVVIHLTVTPNTGDAPFTYSGGLYY